MAAGYWKYPDDILGTRRVERVFAPRMDAATREQLYAGWKRAVERARHWA
jgi:glycerol kinase